jgi:hypothetical protein
LYGRGDPEIRREAVIVTKGELTLETDAVTREKRNATLETVAVATVVPFFGVKRVTRRATVWPGTMTVASVEPWKVFEGTKTLSNQ